jgi:hypothetical protein
MKKKTMSKEKYCGNCYHHCVYSYPDQIFCMSRFLKRENPIVFTLDVCENWSPDYEGCFCVQEAVRKHRGKS